MTDHRTTSRGTGDRCAVQAEAVGEPLAGTAPVTTGWLLVEEPGTWGPEALRDCGLDPEVAEALGDWSDRTGGRVALIRRPDRAGSPDGPRQWFLVDPRAGHEQIRGGRAGSDAELLEVIETADGLPGTPVADPLYLVCTHGRHDACCAIRGRPVAAALHERYPERAWESTHLGGHRFAANLVVLPHALYYGQVPPDEALRLVEHHGRGLLDPARLRGRSCFPAQVQAAQHHARLAVAEQRIDALTPTDMEHDGTDVWTIRLRHDGGDVAVRLRERMADVGPLSCGDGPGRYRAFDLIDIAVPALR